MLALGAIGAAFPAVAGAIPDVASSSGSEDDAEISLRLREEIIRDDANSDCAIRVEVSGALVPLTANDSIIVELREEDFLLSDLVWEASHLVTGAEASAGFVALDFECDGLIPHEDEDTLRLFAQAEVRKDACGLLCSYDTPRTPVLALPVIDDDSVDLSVGGDDDDASASDLGGGAVIAGRIARDSDWYRFESAQAFNLRIDLAFLHDEGDLDMDLYDGGVTRIARIDSSSDDESYAQAGMIPGTYYLRVYPFNGGDFNFYDLEIATSAGCECTPTEVEEIACGRCGLRRRTCRNDCVWGDFGECSDEVGVCLPGSEQSESCGRCGVRSRSCDATCTWSAFSACSGEGECTAGAVERDSSGCPGGGERERSCDASCTWGDFGACAECGAGESQPCYDGPNGTQARAPCQAGMRMCSGGVFGACLGQVLPGDEAPNGVDDDCDGATDEGFGLGTACGTGSCAGGVIELAGNGQDVRCNTMPGGSNDRSRSERCDGADDDCDGGTDEGFGLGTDCGTGACAGGVLECNAAGDGTRCSRESGGSDARAATERCDAADNDCDGTTDEDFALGEACGAGRCGGGVLQCNAAQDGTACSTDALSRDERCDGVDDDCDGDTDEDFALGTPCGRGRCSGGVLECDGDDVRCSTELGGSAAVQRNERCDGLDDDCDGETDEGFALGETCGSGACDGARTVCTPGGEGVRCSEEGGAELCDGIDNDCDGDTDEGFTLGEACGRGVCEGGVRECLADGLGTVCSTATGGSAEALSEERCNGLDDDCDGTTDEGFEIGGSCGLGACAGGAFECDGAGAGTVCSSGPGGSVSRVHEERCDGVDNDCDGETDEGFTLGEDCGVGACAGGRTICGEDGAATICDSATLVAGERCDGVDNDCDGEIDEGFALGGPCGVGNCAGGMTVCAADGMGTACSTDARMAAESCNAVDDDCDGETDEGCDGPEPTMPPGMQECGDDLDCGESQRCVAGRCAQGPAVSSGGGSGGCQGAAPGPWSLLALGLLALRRRR